VEGIVDLPEWVIGVYEGLCRNWLIHDSEARIMQSRDFFAAPLSKVSALAEGLLNVGFGLGVFIILI
jgi:hypothetical protein